MLSNNVVTATDLVICNLWMEAPDLGKEATIVPFCFGGAAFFGLDSFFFSSTASSRDEPSKPFFV